MDVAVYGIADLHLANDSQERYRMDRFGGAWIGHPDNLLSHWRRTVPDDALVLVPGDITMEVKPDAASRDLARLDALPGACKVMVKGNHDMGFGRSLSKWRAQCEPYDSLVALLGTAQRVTLPNEASVIVCGTKGAYLPGDPFFCAGLDSETQSMVADPQREAHNRKLYERELRRLHAALDEAAALRADGEPLICCVHYPPLSALTEPSAFTEVIEAAGVDLCVFGHLHLADQHARVFQGVRGRTRYRLLAADALNMTPRRLGSLGAGGLRFDD